MTAVIYTEIDFDSRDLLYPYKDEMVQAYFEQKSSGMGNAFYTNEVIEKNIIPKIQKYASKLFDVKAQRVVTYIYVQNNEKKITRFHHHMTCSPNGDLGSLTAALYLDVPKVGGEFQFLPRILNPETYEDDLKDHTFKVEENKLYFFPSWWMHRPLPQEDETYRVCLSFSLCNSDRPILQTENVIW